MKALLVLALVAALTGSGLTSASLEAQDDQTTRVRVGTYNLRNYLTMDRRVGGVYRPDYPKPEVEKTALRAVIREADADVLVVQEIGPLPYLEELRQDLQSEGLDYPHFFLLEAADEERHCAVLSRFPFSAENSIDLLLFNYFGEEEAVKRGLIELEFETAGQQWGLFAVHLKSRYTDRPDDPESETRRVGEARAVRNAVLRRYPDPGDDLYLVVGDLNDTRASRTVAAFLKRGQTEITIDVPAFNKWGQTWTHHYQKEEIYSRSDYILASPGILPLIRGGRGVVLECEPAALASDHRLVYVDLNFPLPVAEVEVDEAMVESTNEAGAEPEAE